MFFENMDEFVYVVDMDTHELVYMNKQAREMFGVRAPEDFLGRKCYEMLQGNSLPCAFCNNNELKPSCFLEWRYYNPIIGKHLFLRDSMIEEGGRRLRIELALDISVQEMKERMFSQHHDFEKVVNTALRTALSADTPDESIHIVLEYIGKALQGDRTYIFEKNQRGGDDNTYEWVAYGVKPEKENLQDVAPDVCANWYRNFQEGKHIIIPDLEGIREEDPLMYEALKRQNIRTLVVVPLYDSGKVIAFYGVDNPSQTQLEYASGMLDAMGFFLISLLKARTMLRQLREISLLDQLTRLGNRHAMNKCIANMPHGESVGVVYCDVTGLKRINDTEGHDAGDRLILRASNCLRQVFVNDSLFRIGGDEFLVLCSGISEKALAERVDLLKTVLEKDAVSMAVGYSWDASGIGNIDELLSTSERLMYQDKKAYYMVAGIDRRK